MAVGAVERHFVTIVCTPGESRLNVTAPLAMSLVWMRPVASAVPPETATNAVRAQATANVVRMVVEPFDEFMLADPSATRGKADADRHDGIRSGTKEDVPGSERRPLP